MSEMKDDTQALVNMANEAIDEINIAGIAKVLAVVIMTATKHIVNAINRNAEATELLAHWLRPV